MLKINQTIFFAGIIFRPFQRDQNLLEMQCSAFDESGFSLNPFVIIKLYKSENNKTSNIVWYRKSTERHKCSIFNEYSMCFSNKTDLRRIFVRALVSVDDDSYNTSYGCEIYYPSNRGRIEQHYHFWSSFTNCTHAHLDVETRG